MAMPAITAAAAGSITIADDLEVARLGFGAMRITGDGIWGPPPDRDEALHVLRRAVELGVTFIDTADSYGPDTSEELIAEALYPYPDGLVIASKGGHTRPAPGVWDVDGRPEHLRAACEGTLRKLRLDTIPLYQMHRPDPSVPYEESVGALAELRDEGKIRHIGVSNVSLEQLAAAQSIAPIATVQNRFNMGDRRSADVLDACTTAGIVFIPYAPIKDWDGSAALAEIAKAHEVTTQQAVLAWILAYSPVMLPIPGTGSVAHLEENIAGASVVLSDAELASLRESS
jgi:aryl-alcohol dehydrogenase-like predicted oxidoreductase